MSNQIKPNIKKLKKFNFITVGIILVIVTLLIAAILVILTPAEEKIIANNFTVNNYDDTQTTFKKVTYTGPEFTLPENFNIYQTQAGTGLAKELADRLIRDYQLTADAQIENYWLGENNSLIKSNYEHNYTFSSANTEKGNSDLAIVVEEAISVCQNFYSKYNIALPLIPQKSDISYLNSGFEQSIVAADKATFLQIPLTYELDGYKVFYENQSDYPFFCRVNNFYTLEKVIFRDFLQDFQVSRQMPSISINQAVNNIKKGNASIIDANSKIVSVIDLNWINQADLYSTSIEYRYDSELKIAYPFYKFKANLTNSAGINIEAEIITPAVSSAVSD